VDFVQVDVFGDAAYRGNALAVFTDSGNLSGDQMQAIAREMNLSETTFVTRVEDESYELRIFTPGDELDFAGHPTIGTAWVLRRAGTLKSDRVIQHSRAGETPVTLTDAGGSFERPGEVEPDLEETKTEANARISRALGLEVAQIGLDARELGRSGRLLPAVSSAGMPMLVVPIRDRGSLRAISVRGDLLEEIAPSGVYCFTATGVGQIEARGLFPDKGIAEDPATGAGAAATGLFLADRMGAIDVRIKQGLQIGRPSLIEVSASPGKVRVTGGCHLVFTGMLEAIPS
jgi:trans-2,3-dihydro-3-hydroxyanthranilate isomerase